jgi:hypothetical protein
VSLAERHDHYPTPTTLHLGSAYDGLGCVVASLDQDVWSEVSNQFQRCILLENNDGINRLDRGQNVRPLTLGPHGPLRPLESLDGSVGVEPNHEGVTLAPGGGEQANVAGMKKIENAVGEDDFPSAVSAPAASVAPGKNFGSGIARFCGQLRTPGG